LPHSHVIDLASAVVAPSSSPLQLRQAFWRKFNRVA